MSQLYDNSYVTVSAKRKAVFPLKLGIASAEKRRLAVTYHGRD